MKAHHSELISALADGELKGLRRWFVQRHVSRCALCAAEYRHIQHVRTMLAANLSTPTMSDSPDFFWSKVKREIVAREGQTAEVPMPTLSVSDWLGQHRFALASAVTTIVLAAGLVFTLRSPTRTADTAVATPKAAHVETVATSIPDTVATPLEQNDNTVAVIWVSGLPWTENMTEMKTRYALLDT